MEKRDDFLIPDEIAEWIGLKKSEYLSKLIQSQSTEDIGFDEFHKFDIHIPSTIENPDRTYQVLDDEQRVRTYVKTYSEKSVFHQVVIGVVLEEKKTNSDIFVPIISFVTRESQLVRNFCVGEVVLRQTLN